MNSNPPASSELIGIPLANKGWDLIIVGIVALGVILRVAFLLSKGTFWLDEASVALNLRESVAFLLAGELHYDQRAPLGWLLLHKPIYLIFGPSAVALRASACLANIAALLFLAWTVHHTLRPPAALAVIGIASFSPSIILYSAEFKHYSFDFLAGAFFAWFVFATCMQGTIRKPVLSFNLAACAFALVSLPGVFCAAAAQVTIALSEKDWSSRVRRFLLTSFWVPVYGAGLYWFAMYNSSNVESELQDFWGFAYMANEDSLRGMLEWPKDWAIHLNELMLGSATASFAAAGLMVAAVLAWQCRSSWLALYSVGVILFSIAASFLALYPTAMRLALFVLPAFLLLTGAGVDWIASHPRRGMLVAWCMTAVLCLASTVFLARAVRQGQVPTSRLGDAVGRMEDISAGVEALRQIDTDSDPIILIPKATMPALAHHYPQGLAPPNRTWVEGKAPLDSTVIFQKNETFSISFLLPKFEDSFIKPSRGNYKSDPYVATQELKEFMGSSWQEGVPVALLVTQGYPLYRRIFVEMETPYPPPQIIDFPGGLVMLFNMEDRRGE